MIHFFILVHFSPLSVCTVQFKYHKVIYGACNEDIIYRDIQLHFSTIRQTWDIVRKNKDALK